MADDKYQFMDERAMSWLKDGCTSPVIKMGCLLFTMPACSPIRPITNGYLCFATGGSWVIMEFIYHQSVPQGTDKDKGPLYTLPL